MSLQPMRFEMASFWSTFHTVLEGTKFGMYSRSTRGPELFFLRFFFVLFFTYIIIFSKTTGKILNNVLRLICRSHAKNKANQTEREKIKKA